MSKLYLCPECGRRGVTEREDRKAGRLWRIRAADLDEFMTKGER